MNLRRLEIAFVRLASVFTLMLAAGCAANGYNQFFTSTIGAQTVIADNSFVPHVGEPEVYTGKDPVEDDIAMLENGYALVGYSSFNGPWQDAAMAKAKARELHAAVVFLYSKNAQTVTETVPTLDLSGIADAIAPKTETTHTSGTIRGDGGSATYSGTSTKVVPREKKPATTTYTTTRYDQSARFWVKARPPRLGIIPRDLTAEERAARQSNKGVVVLAVKKGSPAFSADVLRGDILMKIGDAQIAGAEDFVSALERYAGMEVDLLLVRGTVEKVIRVRLNPASYATDNP